MQQHRKETTYPPTSHSTNCPPQRSSSPSRQVPPQPSTSQTMQSHNQSDEINQKSLSSTNSPNPEASPTSNQSLTSPVATNCQLVATNSSLTSSSKKSPKPSVSVEERRVDKALQQPSADKASPKPCQSLTINCQALVATAPPTENRKSPSTSPGVCSTNSPPLLVVRSQTIAPCPDSTESSFRKTKCWNFLTHHQTKKSPTLSPRKMCQEPLAYSTHCSQVISLEWFYVQGSRRSEKTRKSNFQGLIRAAKSHCW